MGNFGTPKVWTRYRGNLDCEGAGSRWLRFWGCRGRSPVESARPGDDEVCGLLADGYHFLQILGGKPGLVAASGRDQPLVSSSLDTHATVRGGLTARSVSAADRVLGNSVGANGWPLAHTA